MSISLVAAQRHVARWGAAFERYPTSLWPSSIFHHAQVDAAVEIIGRGGIVCRADQNKLVCDVANQGALGNNIDAHNYARLYFRPKNVYHLKTEGIKSASDHYRQDPHMDVPVAFVFDFVKVMTQHDALFTCGNFAKTGTAPLNGDEEFEKLDFSQIYHDSNPGSNGVQIQNMRMSEVIFPKFLSLEFLKSIVCRTTHEARMLRFRLNRRGLSCQDIKVEQRGSIFFRRGIFIDEISLVNNVLNLRFHAPTTYSKSEYELRVKVTDAAGLVREGQWMVPSRAIRISSMPSDAASVWQISIEGCTAYEGLVPSSTGLIA